MHYALSKGFSMYAYCMFCLTQRCKVIAKLMEIRGAFRSFSPQIVRKQRKKGVNKEVLFDLLPGYVFVFSEERMLDYALFFGMDGVIRRVGKQENGYELAGSDLDFAMKLFEKDGLVGSMKACRIGDEVTLEEPLFNGCQGRIRQSDFFMRTPFWVSKYQNGTGRRNQFSPPEMSLMRSLE